MLMNYDRQLCFLLISLEISPIPYFVYYSIDRSTMGIAFFTLLLTQINVDEATPGLQRPRGGCMPSLLSDRKKKLQKINLRRFLSLIAHMNQFLLHLLFDLSSQ
jgi:hypothetical protein